MRHGGCNPDQTMILLVDDKQENLFSLRTVLQQQGFETDTAESGEEALKKVLRNDYALFILDVQMPGMDGFEVAEALTSLNKTRDIPIIFLSAVNTHKRFITKGFESGAVDYLTKPVDPDILTLKVRNFYRLYERTQALREAEKALSATVTELRTTLESLPQLAFTASRNGEIEQVNHQWFEFALTRDTFPETQPGTPSLQEVWLQGIEAGQPLECEVSIRKRDDGIYYYHLLRATPVFINGQIRKWVATLTSINEQKLVNELLERKVEFRTRELLRINHELEVTNNDLQQFTSVASHDLKEPLRKIQFFGNLLHDQASLEGKPALYLEKIIAASSRMSNLITDLLSFAQLSRSELFQLTDIRLIIDEIVQDFEVTITEKQAVIEIGSIAKLEAIPALIRQLFHNLISNALKFARKGEQPRIRIWSESTGTPDADAPPEADGAYCRIFVSDNGIGFDEAYTDKIFTLFQRLNEREAYEGTGIGLTIAKKIVDKHHGFITARSQPGEGATFIIVLPCKQSFGSSDYSLPVQTELHS